MIEKELLKKYLFGELIKESKLESWNDEDSLLEKGIIDSLNLVQILTFIGEKFRVKIDDEDLTPENFETINAIYNLIKKKLSQ